VIHTEAAVLDLAPLSRFALRRSCQVDGYEKGNRVRIVRRLVNRCSFVDTPTYRCGSLLHTRLS